MKKSIDALFKGIEVLISVCLAIMILLVFLNVILRQFRLGSAATEEIARLCFIYLVYMGSILAMRDNKHLLIETLLVRLPKGGARAVFVVLQVIIIWLMYLVARGTFDYMWMMKADKLVATGTPMWIMYLPGLIMGISIMILSAVNIYKAVCTKATLLELIMPHDEDEAEPTAKEA
ncbi:MAG: TRAP transporter small permease [Hungatella sp.]|jgi:TRAP-type C4-dicarboxylate transport system permease small subunit|nr:TRAP transporter small permease [Hungatella sp.]